MHDSEIHSRVLTLVFTDLADSTALKSIKGDHAVGDIIARHRAHVIRLAEESLGRVIDWAGDGCFLTFDTSSAAVTFALRLQGVHSSDADLPAVRTGIHVGEVTEKPGPGETVRIEGLSVDIAARICHLAHPGQVLLSSAVYNSVRQRLGVEDFGRPVLWQAHGTYEFKGFDDPLDIGEAGLEGCATLEAPRAGDKARRIQRARRAHARRIPLTALALVLLAALTLGLFYLAWNGSGELGESTLAALPGNSDTDVIRDIAVLPIESLSDNPNDDFLAEGMTDAIISELAKIESIRVISSRSSSAYKKGTSKTTPQIAKELGVTGIVEATMQRDGNEVLVIANLIHGPSDDNLWSNKYQKETSSIFELYADVALAIAAAIEARVTGEERARIADVQRVDPAAYEAYVLGHHYMNTITRDGLNRAVEYFQQATILDENFAHAWGGLVCAYVEFPQFGIGEPRDYYPKAREAGYKATTLDDDLGRDHAHLGTVSMAYDWEWETAENRFLHGLILSPSDPVIHTDYAIYLMLTGRSEEALKHVSIALDLEPNAPAFFSRVATAQVQLERFPESVRTRMETLREEEPEFLPATETLARAYLYLDMHEEAVAVSEQWVEQVGEDVAPSMINLARVYADTGKDDQARIVLNQIVGLEGYYDKSGVAYAYVSLGEFDTAFEWLEKSKNVRDTGLLWLRTIPYWKMYIDDPNWIAFRNDPRFWELIDLIDFPPLPKEHPGFADEQAHKAASDR